ncbi:hypothetical protein V1525DRAFT_410630 [Lipomyces kononenkoae]|uniref:Uncharacterized protein n=1 Tax=Lipomyces kononenkoae TaxID=34357 RepID=A0ACC3SUA7_LIPKO
MMETVMSAVDDHYRGFYCMSLVSVDISIDITSQYCLVLYMICPLSVYLCRFLPLRCLGCVWLVIFLRLLVCSSAGLCISGLYLRCLL